MNEDLSQPWPHPFEPSTASDGAGHIEINPSMLPPTMTPPQTDLDRLNELYAAMQKGEADRGSPEDMAFLSAIEDAFPALLAHIRELEQDLYETNESYEKAAHDRDAAVRDCRKLRAQLTTAQADARRLRGALEGVRSDLQCTIDLYNSNGPEWTSEQTGSEYYSASFVIDSAQEKIDAIDAALLTTPVKAEGHIKLHFQDFTTIYVASKTKHAAMWRKLRSQGHPIISTWIDEAEAGQSSNLPDLALRCIREASEALFTVLYCEPGETLKGALMEAGAALSACHEVRCVGTCENLSPVLALHPQWKIFTTVEEAISYRKPATPPADEIGVAAINKEGK